MTEQDASTLLMQGIAAAKGGQRDRARSLLLKVIELDDRNERAWLWLSGVVDGLEDQIVCLENVLTVNPAHAAAQRGLEKLRAMLPPQEPELEAEPADLLSEALLGWSEPIPPAEQPPEPAAEMSFDEWLNQPPPFDIEAEAEPLEQPAPSDLDSPVWTQPDTVAESRACTLCGTVNPAWRETCSLCNSPITGEPGFDASVPTAVSFPIADGEPDEVEFVPEIDTRPQGLLTLGAAWIAALTLNKRGAYEFEIYSASTGRTIIGLLVGGILVPFGFLLLAGVMFAFSSGSDTLQLITGVAGSTTALICASIPAGLSLIVQFYLLAAAVYVIAWLMGGKASFVIHSQLLSVAFSAGMLLISFMVVVGALATLVVTELLSSSLSSEVVGLLSLSIPLLFSLVASLYTLAMYGQAISVAHRFSWLGGVGVFLLSGLICGLLGILVALVLLYATGTSLPDLTTLLTPIP